MSTGILLITHQNIGKAFAEVAESMITDNQTPIRIVEINFEFDLDHIVTEAEIAIKEADQGNGVLILTDAFGSTPSNISMRLLESNKGIAVAGLNLPMLIRVLNYAELPLEQLADKAVSGGLDGVTLFTAKGPRK